MELFSTQEEKISGILNPLPFDANELDVFYNVDELPITVLYKKDGNVVKTLTITYDLNQNPINLLYT